MSSAILGNLDVPPKARDLYLWCDFIELLCVADIDKRFSRGNFTELLSELRSMPIAAIEGEGDDDEEGEEDDSEGLGEIEDDGLGQQEADDAIAVQKLPGADKNESRAADLYGNLQFRAANFGDAYPFTIDAAGQELTLVEDRSVLQDLYLQLLLSSSLRFVPKARRHELTDPFEQLSTEVFRCLMPIGWEVHPFGAKSKGRYKGKLFDRFERLASDWNGVHKLSKHHYKAGNSGDGGLDIVAWHPLGNDGRVGIPIAAAQCGCTAEEWGMKTLQASPANLSGTIGVQHRWATYYFMPQDLTTSHNGKKDWQRRNHLTECIVIDRLRILRLVSDYGIEEKVPSPTKLAREASCLAAA